MPDLFIPKEEKITPAPQPTPPPVAEPTRPITHLSTSRVLPFSTYTEKPTNISFTTQESDEEILLFMRPHFITNITWILTTLVLFLIPPVVITLFGLASNLFPFSLSDIPTNYLLVFLLFYYLISFTFMFSHYLTWFYNIGIVTQKRIIDIDYRDIIYHNVAMTKLNLVEDVNYTQGGFAASLFNFGDIFVQTAGETKHFDFYSVPKPARTTSIIEDHIGGRRHV